MRNVTQDELDQIDQWAAEGQEQGTRYHAMSFEDGIRHMVAFLDGELTLEELLDEDG